MRDDIANIVHPILAHALKLRERLKIDDSIDFYNEQANLKGMLLSDLDARRLSDYGGDPGDHSGRRSPDQFLGIRYALACWLDEIFIIDSKWESQWNERKIEESLYGTNDRAWNFWEQAQLAEAKATSDAIEVMYLLVMLGFRGDLREKPDRLKTWTDAVGKRIARDQGKDWPVPPELDPPSSVPPLHGRARLHKMVLAVAVFTFGLVPIVAFFLVTQLLGR
jgi:type VI secretion system protein ImpK